MQKRSLFLTCLLTSVLSTAFAGGPGTIANTPLITSTVVPPNIMFLIDSSGSMINVLQDAPYDPTVTYPRCTTSSMILSSSNMVYLGISSSNIPYVIYNNTSYAWGTTSGRGVNNYPNACFDPSQTYTADLYADSVSGSVRYASGAGGGAPYSGNYLNWYFGTSPTNWGSTAVQKPGTVTRIATIQSVTTQILNSLNGVRVGLSRFNFASGALILVGMNDINTNKSAMINALNSIDATDWTPLAEALYQIGDYFVGSYGGSLTLHPGQSNQTTKSASTVFQQTAAFSSGVSQSSPIQYYCQKNFVIVLTDGQPTQDTNIPSTSGLTDYDGDCSGTNASNCTTFDRKLDEFYDPSGGSDYLDDIATALYDMDLRPDLSSPTGATVKNNIITYTIGFADPSVLQTPLLAETAAQGGGLALIAENSSDLLQAFQAINTNISGLVNAQTAAAFNSVNLTANSNFYLAKFFTVPWSGDLTKYSLNTDGTVGASQWAAAALLDKATPTNRVVLTYNPDNKTGVAFRTLSNLSAAMRADLNTSPTGTTDSLGQSRINYLRGDTTLDGTTFRKRTHILGDIVNSSPVYVGAPISNWPDTAPFPTGTTNQYSTFQKGSAASRTPIVYVGANDGMLHGFNANTGQDVMSYVPNNLASASQQLGLHFLTDPAYSHIYYVDLSPTVQDAYIATTSGGAKSWRTVLVGGERGGGRGYFALDVTDPGQFTEGNANNVHLWEFNSTTNNDLGYTFSEPTIGLMNNGRFAAIFGNGYNSTNGKAKLFIVFLDGGLNGTWTLGTDYLVIDTKVGATTSASTMNGLSSPIGVDIDGNQTIDRIYAGDLYGNLWAFDVSSTSTGSWTTAYGTSTAPAPLFTTGTNKPITAKPVVAQNPLALTTITDAPNLLVLFGSGQFITTQDLTTTNTQSFYGVWDSGTGSLSESKLVTQTFTVSGGNRIMSSLPVTYSASLPSTGKFGWMINLTAGERVITSALVRNGIVYFTTLIPNTSGACSFGGTGWLMGVNISTGGQPNNNILDINNDSQLTDADKINGNVVSGIYFSQVIPMQPAVRGNYIFVPTSQGLIQQYLIPSMSQQLGRMSWRELTH